MSFPKAGLHTAAGVYASAGLYRSAGLYASAGLCASAGLYGAACVHVARMSGRLVSEHVRDVHSRPESQPHASRSGRADGDLRGRHIQLLAEQVRDMFVSRRRADLAWPLAASFRRVHHAPHESGELMRRRLGVVVPADIPELIAIPRQLRVGGQERIQSMKLSGVKLSPGRVAHMYDSLRRRRRGDDRELRGWRRRSACWCSETDQAPGEGERNKKSSRHGRSSSWRFATSSSDGDVLALLAEVIAVNALDLVPLSG